jgi:PAS domain S-box-containing protein
MELAGEAVVVTSAELDTPGPRILYVNPAFTRMTGYAPEEVLGQTPRMLQGPRTDRRVLDRMRVDLDATGQFHGEAVNYAKDGTPYVIDWLITGACDDTGRVTEWVSVQRDVTDRKAMEERHELLLGELQHRVRNNLAVIRSIVRRTAEMSGSAEEQAMHLDGRLDVFARVQSLVTQDPGTWIDLGRMVSDELLAHAAHEGAQARTSGPSVRLRPRTAELLGLALHELAVNAVKYGALQSDGGQVAVTWRVEATGSGTHLILEWRETGVPVLSPAPRHRGFGTAMLEQTLTYELGATASLSFLPGGLTCTIALPLSEGVALVKEMPDDHFGP